MAQELKFNVGEATSTKKQIEKKAVEIQNIMKEVKSSMQSVSSWWKGDAVNSFIAQYEKIEKDVTKLIESINTIGKQLESQAKAQQEEDQNIAAKLGKAGK